MRERERENTRRVPKMGALVKAGETAGNLCSVRGGGASNNRKPAKGNEHGAELMFSLRKDHRFKIFKRTAGRRFRKNWQAAASIGQLHGLTVLNLAAITPRERQLIWSSPPSSQGDRWRPHCAPL